MLETGVQKAIYEVDFATPQDGVAVGQDGIVLKTSDSGETWTRIPIELPLQDWQVAQPHYFAVSRARTRNTSGPSVRWALLSRSQDVERPGRISRCGVI